MEQLSSQPYECKRCRRNCINGKDICLTLGANDVIKRYRGDEDYEYDRTAVTLKWTKGLNWIKYKLKASGVRTIYFMSVPNWTHYETHLQRYYSQIRL